MDKALQTQLANIQKRTGKSIEELTKVVKASGLAKHGEIRDMLKNTLGLGHGDANVIAHLALKSSPVFDQGAETPARAADRIYTGPKAQLRAIHDRIMKEVGAFGPFEVAPKKTYLSLRRKKQFATLGPGTNTRVDVGLNMKGVAAGGRLEALPPGGMCQYRIKLTTASEVDGEVIGWIRQAYDGSG